MACMHMKEQLSVKEVCSKSMIQVWTLTDDFIYTSQVERAEWSTTPVESANGGLHPTAHL